MFQLLVPGYLEDMLSMTTSNGNMGLNGIYLGFYYRRNFVWFSGLLLFFHVNFLTVLLFSFFGFWLYFNKWNKFCSL